MEILISIKLSKNEAISSGYNLLTCAITNVTAHVYSLHPEEMASTLL